MSGGVEALKIQWGPGKMPLIPASLGATIQGWVQKGPAGCGLNRAKWTYAELVDYRYKQSGIWVSETTMREYCQRHQLRPYRPTYRFLRADPEKKKHAKEEVRDLKKKPKSASSSC